MIEDEHSLSGSRRLLFCNIIIAEPSGNLTSMTLHLTCSPIHQELLRFRDRRYTRRNEVCICGNSSVGRAQPCQGWGRRFESGFPLWKEEASGMCLIEMFLPIRRRSQAVRQRPAKPLFPGSNPGGAFFTPAALVEMDLDLYHWSQLTERYRTRSYHDLIYFL